MTLNGVMAYTLHYFTEFGKPALQKTIVKRHSRSPILILIESLYATFNAFAEMCMIPCEYRDTCLYLSRNKLFS